MRLLLPLSLLLALACMCGGPSSTPPNEPTPAMAPAAAPPAAQTPPEAPRAFAGWSDPGKEIASRMEALGWTQAIDCSAETESDPKTWSCVLKKGEEGVLVLYQRAADEDGARKLLGEGSAERNVVGDPTGAVHARDGDAVIAVTAYDGTAAAAVAAAVLPDSADGAALLPKLGEALTAQGVTAVHCGETTQQDGGSGRNCGFQKDGKLGLFTLGTRAGGVTARMNTGMNYMVMLPTGTGMISVADPVEGQAILDALAPSGAP